MLRGYLRNAENLTSLSILIKFIDRLYLVGLKILPQISQAEKTTPKNRKQSENLCIFTFTLEFGIIYSVAFYSNVAPLTLFS